MVVRSYVRGDLPGFFSCRTTGDTWFSRGNTCRELFEPIDIACFYRYALWKSWLPNRRHYHESHNRPTYYEFLEAIAQSRLQDMMVAPALTYAKRLAAECNRMEALQNTCSGHSL